MLSPSWAWKRRFTIFRGVSMDIICIIRHEQKESIDGFGLEPNIVLYEVRVERTFDEAEDCYKHEIVVKVDGQDHHNFDDWDGHKYRDVIGEALYVLFRQCS